MLVSSDAKHPGSQDGTDGLLSRLSACVTAQMGLDFPPSRWGDLARGVAAAAQDFGWQSEDGLRELEGMTATGHADIIRSVVRGDTP